MPCVCGTRLSIVYTKYSNLFVRQSVLLPFSSSVYLFFFVQSHACVFCSDYVLSFHLFVPLLIAEGSRVLGRTKIEAIAIPLCHRPLCSLTHRFVSLLFNFDVGSFSHCKSD